MSSAPRQCPEPRRATTRKGCVQVQDVEGVVERLLGFLDTGKPFVTAEAVIQARPRSRDASCPCSVLYSTVSAAQSLCQAGSSRAPAAPWHPCRSPSAVCPSAPRLRPAQVRDLMRRFPDAAEACVASVSGISPQARGPPASLGWHASREELAPNLHHQGFILCHHGGAARLALPISLGVRKVLLAAGARRW